MRVRVNSNDRWQWRRKLFRVSTCVYVCVCVYTCVCPALPLPAPLTEGLPFPSDQDLEEPSSNIQ